MVYVHYRAKGLNLGLSVWRPCALQLSFPTPRVDPSYQLSLFKCCLRSEPLPQGVRLEKVREGLAFQLGFSGCALLTLPNKDEKLYSDSMFSQWLVQRGYRR